jgi:hypothetical protein
MRTGMRIESLLSIPIVSTLLACLAYDENLGVLRPGGGQAWRIMHPPARIHTS